MQLGRQPRAAGPRQLVGVDARDELRIDRGLQDLARLADREVAGVAEHVAEARAGRPRIRAPRRDLGGVAREAGAAIGRRRVRGEKRDLDARYVVAVAEPLEDAYGGELAVVVQVVARL